MTFKNPCIRAYVPTDRFADIADELRVGIDEHTSESRPSYSLPLIMKYIFLVFLMSFSAFAASPEPTKESVNDGQENTKTESYKTDKIPLSINITTSSSNHQPAGKVQGEHHKPSSEESIATATWGLFWVTFALAAFTAFLFGATLILARDARQTSRRQAEEMQTSLKIAADSAKVARDEFHYIHRPILTIRREQIRYFPKDNGINFVLANIGHLVATNISGQFNVRVRAER